MFNGLTRRDFIKTTSLAALGFMVAGCGGDGQGNSGQGSGGSDKPADLVVYGKIFTSEDNKIVEGNRERIQIFEGVVIGRQGSGVREMFTVRRISYGVGVERMFPVHSPRVDKIEVVRRGAVRRAKLYYLRKLTGKAARIKEKKQK